jgi:hypothetical protein
MSQAWILFTPLPARDALELVDRCNETIEGYLEEHPDGDDEYGRVAPTGPIPSRDEVVETYRRCRLTLPYATLDKLAACRSAIAIWSPSGGRTAAGELVEVSPLQASILGYLLARAGDGLVMFNDYPLVGARITLLDLRLHDKAPEFPP